MEAFSLLKYWKIGGGGGTTTDSTITSTTTTTTIATTVREMAEETDDECDDEGPFFDLEFAVPDEDAEENDDDDSNNSREDEEENDDDDDDSEDSDGEPEFNFAVSPGSSGGRTDPNLTFSPSDDLFFKGKLVPLEPSSHVFNQSEINSNKPQFPVSLLKTATKFRVFMLGFKKPKSTGTDKLVDNNGASGEPQKPQQPQQQQQQSKFFTVKLKVEEVPIISLFTRDNSSKSSAGNKTNKQSSDEIHAEEKKFSKDVVQKYLKMIKPLYVKVSKRYGEKLGFSGQLSLGSGKSGLTTTTTAVSTTTTLPVTSPSKNEVEKVESEGTVKNVKNQKPGNLPTGFRVVRKHLGKSRSASSAVAAVTPVGVQAKRRDDSLLQQQDGIQSAILHCKRSFNASRDTDSCALSRSSSDQSHEQSTDSTRTSFDEVVEARM